MIVAEIRAKLGDARSGGGAGHPELIKIFCEDYVAEMNRLSAGQGDARTKLERDLAATIADHDKLVDAIVAGVPAARVKPRMEDLARRQAALV